MKYYLLSVVIPVYNVERFLIECIQSLQPQLTDECEVILIDDGSTDSSGSICNHICEKDKHFKVIHKENGGLSDARNEGIKQARGQYILFLDSDDKLSTEGISVILDNIKEYHPDILMGRARVFSDTNGDIDSYNIGSYSDYQNIQDPCKVLLELDKNSKFWFAAWLVIIRKDFLEEKGLYFEKGILHEDERWVPLAFANAKSVRLFDKAFYLYRTNREGSIVSAPRIKREFDKLSTAEYFYNNKSQNAGRMLLKRRAAALVFGTVLSLQLYQQSEEYSILLQEINNRVHIMNYGKYRLVGVLCKVIGTKNVSKLFGGILQK